MHPVNAMFEEIYRDHWGIPQTKGARKRRGHERLFWRRAERSHDGGGARLAV